MKGIIKKLSENGFGFITVAGQKDIFFHANDCVAANFKDLKEGDKVSFETAESDKGPKAVKVMLDSGADDAMGDEAEESEAA